MNVRTNPSSKRSDYYYQEIMLDYFFQHKRLFFRKNDLIEFLQLFESQGLLFLKLFISVPSSSWYDIISFCSFVLKEKKDTLRKNRMFGNLLIHPMCVILSFPPNLVLIYHSFCIIILITSQ